jgi:hypothetical protein
MGQRSRIIISTDTSGVAPGPYTAFFDDEATLQARPVVPLDSIAPSNSIAASDSIAPLDSVAPRRRGKSPWLLAPVVLGASLAGAVIGAAGIRFYAERSAPSNAEAPTSSVSNGVSSAAPTLANVPSTPSPSEQVTKPTTAASSTQLSQDTEAFSPRSAQPLEQPAPEPDRRATGSNSTPNSKPSNALPAEYSPRPDLATKRDAPARSTDNKTAHPEKDDPPPAKKEETRPRRVHNERLPQSISRIREIFEGRQP